MRTWKITLYTFVLIPLSFVISMLAFYFHAGKVLGHAPHYNNPDPKELTIYNDYAPFIDLSTGIWLMTFLPWLILAVVYMIVNRKNISWRPIVITGIAQLLAILILLSGIFEWYVD